MAMNDQDLRQMFQAQLDTEQPFIYGVATTGNDDFVQLEIAQQVYPKSKSGPIDLNAIFLGWNNGTILRNWRNNDISKATTIIKKTAKGTWVGAKTGQPVIGKMFTDLIAEEYGVTSPFTISYREFTEETDPLAVKAITHDRVVAGKDPVEPKRNPTTKEAVMFNDLPVYRDTDLIVGEFSPELHYKEMKQEAAANIQIAKSFEDQQDAAFAALDKMANAQQG